MERDSRYRDGYRHQIVTRLHSVMWVCLCFPRHIHSSWSTVMALLCIPVPRLVSCTFSTIPICPFLIQRHLLVHLKLIFAFAAQSSLSKVRNNNVRNAVRTRGTCAVPTRQHPCRIHKPVLGTRYSGTVPCRKMCTNHDTV